MYILRGARLVLCRSTTSMYIDTQKRTFSPYFQAISRCPYFPTEVATPYPYHADQL